ncbi:MAG: ATP-dependent Clp protease ATP-binding subunit [Patescibacteria group bacterium]|jgi:ATP-dependent Clp protease ATP-binding subunit ClpC
MNSFAEKFTTNSRNALKNAFNLALALGHKTITPQHVLYGLTQQKGSIAAQILTKAKIESLELKQTLANHLPASSAITQINLAPQTRKILEKAFLIASLNRHQFIGTEHLLASIITIKDNLLEDYFKTKNVSLAEMQKQINLVLNSTSKFPDLAESLNYFKNEGRPDNFGGSRTATQSSILDLFAVNLTSETIQKEIDPVIGRADEITRLIQILCRRNKNNPMLLGDPGVGKTAIVEGLAKKIVEGDVPEILLGKTIYALDLSLVVAGTSFRGEFENRLKQIIAEVKKNRDIILFIDEIQNIIGIGSATGSMDAANILKPALARGEIRLIGATTMQDYKKYIESDAALERRFQPIWVNQPSSVETIKILRGIKNRYELYHEVRIKDEAIVAAAELSERYISDRFLPDKAIDLIDEASSAVKINQLTNSTKTEFLQLDSYLKEILKKKQACVTKEKFALAIKYRQEEKKVLTQLKDLKAKKFKSQGKTRPEIDKKDIVRIVAKITGIPLSDLMLEEKTRLLKLEKLLAEKIIGQDKALKAVAEIVRRSKTGISDFNRPLGSFMFLGPSGVGKTELAKVLAETVFGSAQALIRIDMSEFAESFNISKLIGAPAGYVGYKEETKLTDSVKRRPYSIVLFDEIEKAHPQVFSLLLQILEDGHLTDGTGKTINFKNTIIIMTSNLGSENFNRQAAIGFQAKTESKVADFQRSFKETEHNVISQLKTKFPPEFVNRIDKLIVFSPLNSAAIAKIAQRQLTDLKVRLKKQDLDFSFEPKVVKMIAKISYSPQVGARAIRKTIQELIEGQIAEKILTSKNLKTKKITAKIENNQIVI